MPVHPSQSDCQRAALSLCSGWQTSLAPGCALQRRGDVQHWQSAIQRDLASKNPTTTPSANTLHALEMLTGIASPSASQDERMF